MAEEANATPRWIRNGKDLVSLLRDVTVFALLVLLFFFPRVINRSLVDAGFTEGDLAGFKWKKEIRESTDQTKAVGETVSLLEGKLSTLSEQLAALEGQAPDGAVRQELKRLSSEVRSTEQEAKKADRVVKANLGAQQRLSEKVGILDVSTEGWIYLGRVTEDKSAWADGSPVTVEAAAPVIPAGTRLRIKDDAYLRADPSGSALSSAPVLRVVRVGEAVQVSETKYSHAKAGGWFVWAKVSR